MAKNASMERQICFYPNHKYYKIFIAWCHINKHKKAEGSFDIVKKFFDTKYSDHQLNEFVEHYNKMTPDEKAHPGRITDEL